MGRKKGIRDLRICQECGNTFDHVNPKKKFCSTECMLAHNRRIYAWKKKLEANKGREVESVDSINAKALAEGISYGEYVARQYIKNQKWVRQW